MKIPSSPTALVTLTAFIHFTTAMAWVPVDTTSGQPVPSPSAIPLYRDYGNSSEVYYIYFNPDNRELLWRIVNHEGREEIYSQTLPAYVERVSASTFQDSQLYIAGMTTGEHWFICALNQFGEMIWVRQGNDDDKEIHPKNVQISKLAVSDDGKELYAKGDYLEVPLNFALDATNGRSVTFSSARVGRKLLQSGDEPSAEPPDDLFPDPEEHVRVAFLEWTLGILGGVATVGGLAGGAYAIWKFRQSFKAKTKERAEEKVRREKEGWKNEYARRQKEKDFINRLKRYNPHRKAIAFSHGKFQNPFAHLMETSPLALEPDAAVLLKPIDKKSQSETLNMIDEALQKVIVEPSFKEHQLTLAEHFSYDQIELDMFNAAKSGRFNKVTQILDEFPWLINSADTHGNTLIHYAVIGGNLSAINQLLQYGAVVNTANSDGYTPIILAAYLGEYFIFKVLLLSQPRISNEEVSHLFHITAQLDISSRQKYSRFMYILMMDRGLHRRLRFTIPSMPQCSPTSMTQCSPTPVFLDTKYNSISQGGLTILHEAVITGNIDLVDYLIHEEVIESINEVDEYGNTLLHYAVLHDPSDEGNLVKLLIKNGANINAQNELGDTPLHNAIYRGKLKIVRIITQDRFVIRVDIENKDGVTPFFNAILLEKDKKIVEHLLTFKPMLENINRQTILHIVSCQRLSSIEGLLVLLKDLVMPIDFPDRNGDTAMHLAVRNSNLEAMKLFAGKGADINKENNDKKTPKDLAESSHNNEVKKVMADIAQGFYAHEPVRETSFTE